MAGSEQTSDPPHTAGSGHSAHRGQMPGEEINWMRSVIMSTDKFNFLPQVITVSLGLLDIHTGKVLWISKSSHVMYCTVCTMYYAAGGVLAGPGGLAPRPGHLCVRPLHRGSVLHQPRLRVSRDVVSRYPR